MRHLGTGLKVLGAATLLGLLGNSVSIAATGHGFTLGGNNTSPKQTTISRTTDGPVLRLRTKSTAAAPFSVNGRGRVANLNADTVDGVDSTAFARTATTDALTQQVSGARIVADSAGAVAGQAEGKANAAQAAATTADGKASAAQTAAATADGKATAAQSTASTADGKATAAIARLPVVQGYITSSGGPGSSYNRGITSVSRFSTGQYHLVVATPTPFQLDRYVVQVTPVINSGCVAMVAGGNGTLLVFMNSAGGSANPVDCSFYLTVTPL